MKTLSSVLIDSYDGQWETFPSPTDTLEDYNNIIWKTATPPTVENLKDLNVFSTLEERIAAEPIRLLRIERNKQLAASDWTQIPNSALTNKKSAKWKWYRQELRNLPDGLDTVDKVNAVTWPEKPE